MLDPKAIVSKTDPEARSSSPPEATATADDSDRAATLLATPLSELDIPLVEIRVGFAWLKGDPLLVEAAALVRRRAFTVLAKLSELPSVEVAEDTISYLRRLPTASFWAEQSNSTMMFIVQAVEQMRTRRTRSGAC
jgi:hypothetical protein